MRDRYLDHCREVEEIADSKEAEIMKRIQGARVNASETADRIRMPGNTNNAFEDKTDDDFQDSHYVLREISTNFF